MIIIIDLNKGYCWRIVTIAQASACAYQAYWFTFLMRLQADFDAYAGTSGRLRHWAF
jgi:hypothetical protein